MKVNGSDIEAIAADTPRPTPLQTTLQPCNGQQYRYSFELAADATAASTRELLNEVPVRPDRIDVLRFAQSVPVPVMRATHARASGHWIKLHMDANVINVSELRRAGSAQSEPTVVTAQQLSDLPTTLRWVRSTCQKERCVGLILSLSHEQSNAVIASVLHSISASNSPALLLSLRDVADDHAHDEFELQFGRLAPELIQRVVRESYRRFQVCYEAGLGRNPKLEGRVAVRFVIELDGSVRGSSLDSSTLPDSSAVQCIVDSFNGLHFPVPDGGIITVVYPLMLSPG